MTLAPFIFRPHPVHSSVKLAVLSPARRRATFAQPFHGNLAAIGLPDAPPGDLEMKKTLVAFAAAASLGGAAARSTAQAGQTQPVKDAG
jgi:hypothetical protein